MPPSEGAMETAAPSSGENKATLINGYIQASSVDTMFKKLLVRIFRDMPKDPITYMLDFLAENYPKEVAAKFRVDPCVPPRVPLRNQSKGVERRTWH